MVIFHPYSVVDDRPQKSMLFDLSLSILELQYLFHNCLSRHWDQTQRMMPFCSSTLFYRLQYFLAPHYLHCYMILQATNNTAFTDPIPTLLTLSAAISTIFKLCDLCELPVP